MALWSVKYTFINAAPVYTMVACIDFEESGLIFSNGHIFS